MILHTATLYNEPTTASFVAKSVMEMIYY